MYLDTTDLDFHRIARETISKRINDKKEKIKLDELIAKYPDGVTITGVNDINNPKYNPFWIFSFLEDNTKCFSAGGELKKIVEEWVDYCGGNLTKLNEELKKTPIKFRLYKEKTKRGYFYTYADIV